MVMYRDFAQRKARKIGLNGWVKNEPDGSVTVVAQGEKTALERYVALLKKGSVLARVDGVACEWRVPAEKYDGFAIRYAK